MFRTYCRPENIKLLNKHKFNFPLSLGKHVKTFPNLSNKYWGLIYKIALSIEADNRSEHKEPLNTIHLKQSRSNHSHPLYICAQITSSRPGVRGADLTHLIWPVVPSGLSITTYHSSSLLLLINKITDVILFILYWVRCDNVMNREKITFSIWTN